MISESGRIPFGLYRFESVSADGTTTDLGSMQCTGSQMAKRGKDLAKEAKKQVIVSTKIQQIPMVVAVFDPE